MFRGNNLIGAQVFGKGKIYKSRPKDGFVSCIGIIQKEKGNTFTLSIIFIVKSLQKEQNSLAQIYDYDPQSAGINEQSPKSESTPRRLTLSETQVCSQHFSPKKI